MSTPAGPSGNLDKSFLAGVSMADIWANHGIPEFLFFAYQMMFAIITPALITGAFSNRVRIPAYLFFLVFWLVLVCFPYAEEFGAALTFCAY